MSRIDHPVTTPPATQSTPPPEQANEGVYAHQVEQGSTAPDPINTHGTEREIYMQSIRTQSDYMRTRQIDILTRENPEAREEIVSFLSKHLKNNHKKIKEAAGELTDYKRFRTLRPDIGHLAKRKAEAKDAAMEVAQHVDFTKMPPSMQSKVKTYADMLHLSYKGVGMAPSNFAMPEGARALNDKELPKSLAMFYDDQSGLIHTPQSGCKAFLAKKGDEILLIFAGTEIPKNKATGRSHTIVADAVQRLGGYSTMYHDASGITRLLLQQNPTAKLSLVGHSLGGGQAQYALATNVDGNQNRLGAWTYNSAGLSASTLGAIGKERLQQAHPLAMNVRLESDLVSPGSKTGDHLKGVLLGKVWTLPKKGAPAISVSAHFSKALLAALDKAV